jgi:hypothetical protein
MLWLATHESNIKTFLTILRLSSVYLNSGARLHLSG